MPAGSTVRRGMALPADRALETRPQPAALLRESWRGQGETVLTGHRTLRWQLPSSCGTPEESWALEAMIWPENRAQEEWENPSDRAQAE